MENKIHGNKPKQITLPHSRRGLVKLIEMDEKVKLLTQMEANVSPIIVINKFSVKAFRKKRTWGSQR
jgi:predicted glycosyltransferase